MPPFLTVRERKHLRRRGKSDPADALAIARVVAREADLPRFLLYDGARQLGQVLNYRDQLVEQRTREANRFHSELTRRHPGYQAKSRNLVSKRSLRRAQELLEAEPSIETALLLRRLASLAALRGLKAETVHRHRRETYILYILRSPEIAWLRQHDEGCP